MKKNTLLVLLFIGTISMSNAQVNLGKLKDKAKEKTSGVANVGNSVQNNREKGDAAFNEKKYEEAKGYYEKAMAAESSDYVKSQIKSKIDNCDTYIEICNKRKNLIVEFNTKKEYDNLVQEFENGKTSKSSSSYEDKCICDDKMKAMVENARVGAAQQKEDAKKKEQEALALEEKKREEDLYKCSSSKVINDGGVTTSVHKNNLKKIVFSKSKIVHGSENESSFTNTFQITDDIYCMGYLEKSVYNEALSIGHCFPGEGAGFVKLTFNDGSYKAPEWLKTDRLDLKQDDSKSYYNPLISPNKTDVKKDSYEIQRYVNIFQHLPAGTYKIKMEAVYDIPDDEKSGSRSEESYLRKYTTKFGAEKVLAAGEFTLTITEEGKRAMYKKLCGAYQTDIDEYNKSSYTTVSNASTLLKQSTNIDWNKFTLLKIVGLDWQYEKDYWGTVLRRKSFASAFLLNKENGLVYKSKLVFREENISSGGSKYASTTVDVEPMNPEYVRQYKAFCKECIGK